MSETVPYRRLRAAPVQVSDSPSLPLADLSVVWDHEDWHQLVAALAGLGEAAAPGGTR
jgi:hypothetical protein